MRIYLYRFHREIHLNNLTIEQLNLNSIQHSNHDKTPELHVTKFHKQTIPPLLFLFY